MDLKLFTLDEMQDATGVKKNMIRYYEDKGLIKPALGDPGKKSTKYYSEDTLETIKTIKKLVRVYTLDDIKTLIENGKVDEGLKAVELVEKNK